MIDSLVDEAEEYDRPMIENESNSQTKLEQYDGLELPEDIKSYLKDEVDQSYEEDMERAGFIRYEDGEITDIIPYDWLEEHGAVSDRSQNSFEFSDEWSDFVATANEDETRLIGYHTHPRDTPHSDNKDREAIKEQNAPEIIVLEHKGEYRARLLGLPSDEDETVEEYSFESVEVLTRGLQGRDLEF